MGTYPLGSLALNPAGAQRPLAAGVDVEDRVLEALEEAAELGVELLCRAGDGRRWRYSCHSGSAAVWSS